MTWPRRLCVSAMAVYRRPFRASGRRKRPWGRVVSTRVRWVCQTRAYRRRAWSVPLAKPVTGSTLLSTRASPYLDLRYLPSWGAAATAHRPPRMRSQARRRS